MFSLKIWKEIVSQFDYHENSNRVFFATRRNKKNKILTIDSNIYEFTRR